MNYLVYILFDPNGFPFYVGMTAYLRRRAYRWKNEYRTKYYAHVIVAEDLSKITALALEAHFITLIGCQPKGPLVNKASKGGHSGYIQSAETRRRISIAQAGRILSPETRAKMSLAKRNPSDETRQRISIAARNRKSRS